MATSRVPAALDALTAILRASTALQGVRVYDGPEVADSAALAALWVGYDGDPDSDAPGVTQGQEWAGIGAKSRDEHIDITCAIGVRTGASGSTAIKDMRDRAYTYLAAVEAELRADPSLGLPPPAVFAFTEGELYQEPTEYGTQVRLVFHIVARQVRI